MDPTRKPAKTSVPIHHLLADRYSTRAFDPDRPVPFGTLLALFEAARWAPSCSNDQPWRFIFWNRQNDPEGWQTALETLSSGNRPWAKNAPVLVSGIARTHFAHDQSPNRWGEHDTGLATMAFLIEAEVQGLSAHPMGGFDAEKVRTAFGVPSGWHPMTMIAVGYQGSLSLLDEIQKARETGERVREPLDHILFEGGWARAVQNR
jgi:nitroreductase